MKPIKSLLVVGAALSLVQAQAHAATQTCITEQEISGMMAFALPAALEGVQTSCGRHLARDGYFATRGPDLIARYSARKDAAWPMAKQAFIKFGSEKDPKAKKVFESLPDAALQPFVEAMLSEMIGSEVKPDQCNDYERLASLLDPLPPENTAALFGVILSMVGNKPGGKSPNICPAA